jgi:hypothetical protein
MLMWTELEGADGRLRYELLAFINEYCRSMTLQQAREWFDDAFPLLRENRDDTNLAR